MFLKHEIVLGIMSFLVPSPSIGLILGVFVGIYSLWKGYYIAGGLALLVIVANIIYLTFLTKK